MTYKKYILISLIGLAVASSAYAGYWSDFFDRFIPTIIEDNIGANPQALPKWVATSTDQYGNTINAIEIRGSKDLYVDANASTTGSFALEAITGSTQCLEVDTNGLVYGAGAA